MAAAMAMLLQNQAQFEAHLDEDRQLFARIEREMAEIKSLLLQHDQILKHHDETLIRLEQSMKDLPEAIRNKIGSRKAKRVMFAIVN
jgi:hypothetical protein